MAHNFFRWRRSHRLMALALLVTALVYWPGLYGGWLFDDYPNIVDNHGVQPSEITLPAFVQVALSSPASDFKRPLASLSFAMNYLAGGMNPFGWKFLNLVIHLLNGIGVYVLAAQLLQLLHKRQGLADGAPNSTATRVDGVARAGATSGADRSGPMRPDTIAALTAAAWLLLPINLTAVLYVVQREESLANLFVLAGLIAYVSGRQRMLASGSDRPFLQCVASLLIPIVVGVLAKETVVMLPLYALLIEGIIFRFSAPPLQKTDRRIAALFVIFLAIPLIVGMAWLGPKLLRPDAWATRDFTLGTRLLSEARVVCDYIAWTLFPTPGGLSFYHDEFAVSRSLLSPWTTLASLLFLAGLTWFAYASRHRRPLVALGISLYLSSHLLTGTVLPLELVYEHRNYFGSLGLLLAVVPVLAAPATGLALLRRSLLGLLFIHWIALTAYTAIAWGEPLRLAQELSDRAPDSPRAQYELGRTYIIYSRYDPASPFTKLAYEPLERAAAMRESSILPQQALIFMNSRMHLPQKDLWWDTMVAKLKARPPGVQDESSLVALTQCAKDRSCILSDARMTEAFQAALDHPNTSARLLATYSDYVWNLQGNHALGERMIEAALKANPKEAAYRITQIRMLVAIGKYEQARDSLNVLQTLNIGGHLDANIAELRALLSNHQPDAGPI